MKTGDNQGNRDYRKFYLSNLEDYLFHDVRERFQSEKQLNAFDFFCIIIWKANRAKSKIARRIIDKSGSLENGVNRLSNQIFKAADNKERLRILIQEWKFRLPMASAILTVLYPEDFTVYDIRVCEAIGGFHSVNNKVRFESIWDGYVKYLEKVQTIAPEISNLRDKDRYLWGKSFCDDLQVDINNDFRK